jgi:hypothetical protein
MTKPGTKYAALLIPTHRDQEREVRQFTADIITWRGKLPDHMDGSADVQHWREWIGSLAWDELMSERRIVLASMPSERPEVLDHESQKLGSRLNLAWYAYVLAGPSGGCDGQSKLVGGQARSKTVPTFVPTFSATGRDSMQRPATVSGGNVSIQ